MRTGNEVEYDEATVTDHGHCDDSRSRVKPAECCRKFRISAVYHLVYEFTGL